MKKTDRHWTEERIIAAIQRWAQLYGRTPRVVDWNLALARHQGYRDADEIEERFYSGRWPPVGRVQNEFGSWSAGLRAAGFAPNNGRGANLKRG